MHVIKNRKINRFEKKKQSRLKDKNMWNGRRREP